MRTRLIVAGRLERELARCGEAELTYPERGATAGSLPAGFGICGVACCWATDGPCSTPPPR
ncbi:hypothetical protein FRAAL5063 [Frankia alni ACN14a]|uniref:Uncharacterized protein n=1 Tax=Frankia alni (strain DSM 45986 / CECT 9034 / ACN14a) TaxID=326424 RepID=Q0RFN8_FRAAA|nr:hypothetical protein FRAAL5063 [Frankia alni ACN14a]